MCEKRNKKTYRINVRLDDEETRQFAVLLALTGKNITETVILAIATGIKHFSEAYGVEIDLPKLPGG